LRNLIQLKFLKHRLICAKIKKLVRSSKANLAGLIRISHQKIFHSKEFFW
jgi:hypothetical protein